MNVMAIGWGICLLVTIPVALLFGGSPLAVFGLVSVIVILGVLGWNCLRSVKAGGLLAVLRFISWSLGFLWLIGALASLIFYLGGLLQP